MSRLIDIEPIYYALVNRCKNSGATKKRCELDLIHMIERTPTVEAVPNRGWTPCDFCKFSSPSSLDGKPCSVCPAQAREKEVDNEKFV